MISLKPEVNPRTSRRACRFRFDFDGVARKLLEINNTFVGYRYQERSSVVMRRRPVVDRQVKARIMIEPSSKLSQQEKSVGQNGKAKDAENKGSG